MILFGSYTGRDHFHDYMLSVCGLYDTGDRRPNSPIPHNRE